jgi:carbamoyl-phosphate synthase large subunit
VRPSFTLGGSGGGIARDERELRALAERGIKASPVGTVLIEESVLGWKEYELEVMRDRADNFVVICSIENFDPMGVHTGDSITVAPAQTLSDREYQVLRDQARQVITRVGVETGGSNIQFGVNPRDGRVVIIEMNPRVSRSSALASKATGFPIAKIAAKLAIGYTLDEIRNDITRVTPASFEPTLDYVVVKIPRWDFAKFPGVPQTLDTQMRSVGEAMAIGRTFKEALQKGLRSLEIGNWKLESGNWKLESGNWKFDSPTPHRVFEIMDALRAGTSIEKIANESAIDSWFLAQMQEIIEIERELRDYSLVTLPRDLLREAKRFGFSDAQIARLINADAMQIRARRDAPVYHRVDTCAAEFEAFTPYLYSTYETSDESAPSDKQKIMILGGGPNRIGQGIEFDYCCVHAAFALRDLGFETIMVNCNPETVSTDYDTSDRLYFEPLTFEDVLNIVEREQSCVGADGRPPLRGVIVQFGGQTPLKLALPLHRAGVPILGTSPDAIDLAEDRERFSTLLDELKIPQPAHGLARSLDDAREIARTIGYPVLVRPSYVLGGRAMAICYSENDLAHFVAEAIAAAPEHPVLIDRYLEDAYEVDVDAIADGSRVVIGGILQHIEEAGVHSGDSAMVLPPYRVSFFHLNTIREYTQSLGIALGVRGLMNAQFAIKDDIVYVLEVNPRASRTVPFISKAVGVPLAKIAAQVMAGKSLDDLGLIQEPRVDGFFVKEAVLPFKKFLGADALLGPEMRSTGEVMGHASDFGRAFAKAEMAAGNRLPLAGKIFLSVNDYDKSAILKIARDLNALGFQLTATRGTAEFIARVNLPVEPINKVRDGSPHIVDAIRAGQIALIINTPLGRDAHSDGKAIRVAATQYDVPLITTLSAAQAAVSGIRAVKAKQLKVRSLQEHFSRQK